MKRHAWFTGAAGGGLAAVLFAAAPALAQEKAWSLDLGADFSTHYLFRGVPLLGENEVLIPNATFAVGGFSAYYFGYRGDIPSTLTFSGEEVPYSEDDFGADYTFTVGESFSLTLGAVSYQFSERTETEYAFYDTYELYAVASFDVPLSPTLSYWEDMDAVEGGYLQFGIGSSIPLGRRASLDWSAAIGFDFGYNLPESYAAAVGLEESNGDLNDLLIGIDIPIQVTDRLRVHATVQQSISLDVLDDLAIEDETVVSSGASFSF